MRHFMDYLERAFQESSRWDIDNSYASITSTAQGVSLSDCYSVDSY